MKINHDARFSVGLVFEMMMSIITGVLVSMLLAAVVMVLPGTARAMDNVSEPDAGLVKKNEVTSGSVLLKTGKPGLYRLAPGLKTDVRIAG